MKQKHKMIITSIIVITLIACWIYAIIPTRIKENVAWLFNHPPTGIISPGLPERCDYCGVVSGHFWMVEDIYCICSYCQKKVYDAVLGEPNDIIAAIMDGDGVKEDPFIAPSSSEAGAGSSLSVLPASAIIEMEVTAYCPCKRCCGEFADGITASGLDVRDFYGLIVAAPAEYPFGTLMEIPGYGNATVQDRGGVIKGNKLDVFFRTHQEALNWETQIKNVKVYKK